MYVVYRIALILSLLPGFLSVMPDGVLAQASRSPDFIAREKLNRQLSFEQGDSKRYLHRVNWSDSTDNSIINKQWESEHQVKKIAWSGTSWFVVVEVTVDEIFMDTRPEIMARVDTGVSVFQPPEDHLLVYQLKDRALYRNRLDTAVVSQNDEEIINRIEEDPKASPPWYILPPYPQGCDVETALSTDQCELRSGEDDDSRSWKFLYLGTKTNQIDTVPRHVFGLREETGRTIRTFFPGKGMVLERRQGRWFRSTRLVDSRQSVPGEGEQSVDSNGPTAPLNPNSPGALNEPATPNKPNTLPTPSEPNQPNEPN